MVEADINLWAVLVAGVVSMVIGAVWYMALSKPWMKESGITKKQMQGGGVPTPYIISFVAELLIAYMIAHVFFYVYTGGGGIAEGAMTGFYTWLGFAATVTAINYAYQMKSFRLYAMDAGYTLVFFVVSGAIIGAWQ
jgi:hypothetical protein